MRKIVREQNTEVEYLLNCITKAGQVSGDRFEAEYRSVIKTYISTIEWILSTEYIARVANGKLEEQSEDIDDDIILDTMIESALENCSNVYAYIKEVLSFIDNEFPQTNMNEYLQAEIRVKSIRAICDGVCEEDAYYILNEDEKQKLGEFCIKILDEAERRLAVSTIDKKEKIQLLIDMQWVFQEFYKAEFFDDVIYAASWYEQSIDRQCRYLEQIYSFIDTEKEEGLIEKLIPYVSIYLLADRQPDYRKKIEILGKSLEKYEVNNIECNQKIYWYLLNQIYTVNGQIEDALDALEHYMELENGSKFQKDNLCMWLRWIELLIENGDKKAAIQKAYELLEHVDDGTTNYDARICFAAYGCLYALETQEDKKNEYWKKQKKHYQNMSPETDITVDFARRYIDESICPSSQDITDEKMNEIFCLYKRMYQNADTEDCFEAIDALLDICNQNSKYAGYLVMALDLFFPSWYDVYEESEKLQDYCAQIKVLFDKCGIEDEYLYHLLQKNLILYCGEYYYDGAERKEVVAECDYCLLAEKKCEGKKIEEQIEIWDTASVMNYYTNEDEMKLRCYEELEKLYLQKGVTVHNIGKYSEVVSTKVELLECCGKALDIKESLIQWSSEIIHTFAKEDEKTRSNSLELLLDCVIEMEQYVDCVSALYCLATGLFMVAGMEEQKYYDKIEGFTEADFKRVIHVLKNRFSYGECVEEDSDDLTYYVNRSNLIHRLMCEALVY